jgi:hypothetical protein
VEKFEKKSFGIFESDVQSKKKSLKVFDDWRKSQNLKNNFGLFGKKGYGERGLEGTGDWRETAVNLIVFVDNFCWRKVV